MTTHRVAVVVPSDFAIFELGVAVEIFGLRDPSLPDSWYAVKVCTGSPGMHMAERGVLAAEIRYGVEAIAQADTVIVPQMPAAEPPQELVLDAIRDAYGRGARVVSFCTGAFVLAAAGILDGRTATTHWEYAARLAREYPRVRVHADVLYVDDGQVLSSAGTTAAVDLGLHIVRKDFGARVARHVARHMVMPPHREGGQAQFMMNPIPEKTGISTGIHRVLAHLSSHLDEDLGLETMAGLAYMSTRNFSRRFREVTGTTPSRWILNQRLTRARELLEETEEPIERVAEFAGFGSAVTLRQRFASELHTSPSAYRRAFRSREGAAQEQLDPQELIGDPVALRAQAVVAFLRESVGLTHAI